MALTANFSSSEGLSNLDQVTFLDTSTGSDGGLTSRRIYIRLANGNWLTTAGESTTSAYETWDIGDTSIVLSLLSSSTTASVTVNWMTGSTVTYTKTILSEWDLYDYVFLFGLLSVQTSAPTRDTNTGYWQNSFKMVTNLFQSESAVTYMDDLYSSQAALDRNQLFITNENLYF